MDNRDMDLIELLESGKELPEEKLHRLIYTLLKGSFGPNTIQGTTIAHMDPKDPQVMRLTMRIKLAEFRALMHMRLSIWYVHNAWPPMPGMDRPRIRFRTWINHRLRDFPSHSIHPVYAWNAKTMHAIN